MIILSVDPHVNKPYAVCTIENGLVMGIDEYNDIFNIYDSWAYYEGRDVKVIIEDQYAFLNMKTLIQLAHAAGRIAGVCEVLEFPYEFVQPSVWQKGFNIPRKTKEYSAYQWKKLHVEHLIREAKQYTSLPIKNDDYASAVLMGIWGLQSGQ